MDRKCIVCSKTNKDASLLKCSACEEVVYCSRTCQKKNWKEHKLVCSNNKKTCWICLSGKSKEDGELYKSLCSCKGSHEKLIHKKCAQQLTISIVNNENKQFTHQAICNCSICGQEFGVDLKHIMNETCIDSLKQRISMLTCKEESIDTLMEIFYCYENMISSIVCSDFFFGIAGKEMSFTDCRDIVYKGINCATRLYEITPTQENWKEIGIFSSKLIYFMCSFGKTDEAMESYNDIRSIWKIEHPLINIKIGECFMKVGKYDIAIEIFTNIISPGENNDEYIYECNNNISECYFYNKMYKESLEVLEKNIQITIDSGRIESRIYNSLMFNKSVRLYYLQKYEEVIDICEKVKVYMVDKKYTKKEIYDLNHLIADCYIYLEKQDQAITYYNLCWTFILTQKDNTSDLIMILEKIASCFEAMKKPEEELTILYKLSVLMDIKVGVESMESQKIKLRISEIYILEKKYKEAFNILEKLVEIGKVYYGEGSEAAIVSIEKLNLVKELLNV